MWKASAVRASEWATKPLMSSRRKKAVSMPIMILIRVLLESADLDAMVGRVAVCAWQSQGGNDERTRHLGKKVCERERVEREEKMEPHDIKKEEENRAPAVAEGCRGTKVFLLRWLGWDGG